MVWTGLRRVDASPHLLQVIRMLSPRGRVLLRAARPRQWTKNVLVLAAPLTAGNLDQPSALGRSLTAMALFTAASIGIYLVNDVVDADADRAHPTKAHRPVATGELSSPLALGVAVALVGLALLGAGLLSGMALLGVLGAYVAVALSYSFGLKRVAVVELACVASGFVLRAVAGGAATHIAISPWFLGVGSAGALVVVAGKRSAELSLLGEEGGNHRAVLAQYRESFLFFVRVVAATVALTEYGLWAFARASSLDGGLRDPQAALVRLSIIPFSLALLMVELAIERGDGGAPEQLVLSSRPIQVLGVACVALVAIGIYT